MLPFGGVACAMFVFSVDVLHAQKPKRRTAILGGRSAASPEKPQRSRSVSVASSRDRPRARGRSPAFNALAANFEKPNVRNLSTPPPDVKKLYPKPGPSDSTKVISKSMAIAALKSTFEKPAKTKLFPRSIKGMYCLNFSKTR